jgi:branched-chain amino acid transport system substrate-binding protein
MKKHLLFLVGICLLLLSCSSKNLLQVGVLIDETGVCKSTGLATKAALELKQEQLQQLFNNNSYKQIELQFADTKSDPNLALKHVKEFYKKGIDIIIGPGTSQELAAIANFVNTNDILILSYASTAHSLAISRDNIFRYVTTDISQSKVVAKFLRKNGREYLWQLYRNDVGNISVANLVNGQFRRSGGKKVRRFIYQPGQSDFYEILAQISSEIEGKEKEKCAVYVAGFSEVIKILAQASEFTNLYDNVLWVGSDGTAKLKGVIENHASLRFAMYSKFTVPLNKQQDSFEYKKFAMKLENKIGFSPNIYTITASDILQILAYCGNISDFSKNKKKVIYEYSAKNYGLTGNTKLNKNGDRKEWGYELWRVQGTIAGHKWKSIGIVN